MPLRLPDLHISCFQRRSSHDDKTSVAARRSRLRLQQLPSHLILSSLLPFLDHRDKLAHVTHLCRSFPALTAACFRHDHIVLPVECVTGRHVPYWQRYCQLVSTCPSMWVRDREEWVDAVNAVSGAGRGGGAAEAADANGHLLSPLPIFYSVRSLVMETAAAVEPFFATFTWPSSAFIPAIFPSLTHLDVNTEWDADMAADVEALRRLTDLRSLTIRRHRVTNADFRRLLTLPALTALDLSNCSYVMDRGFGGRVAEQQGARPSPLPRVSCPTLRVLQLPIGAGNGCAGVPEVLLGADVCVAALDTLVLDGWVDAELAHLDDMRASLTALDIRWPRELTLSRLLPPDGKVLPALTHLRLGTERRQFNHRQALYHSLVQQHVGSLSRLHIDLPAFDNEQCRTLLHTVFACGGRLLSLAVLGAGRALEQTYVTMGDREHETHPLSLPPLPALCSLRLGYVQTDEHLRIFLAACPNIRHLEIDQLQVSDNKVSNISDIRLVGELCRHLVTLSLRLRADPYDANYNPFAAPPSSASTSAAVFPQLRAVAVDVVWPLNCAHYREQARSVAALFAIQAPRLQYFLLADTFAYHDLLPAVRVLRHATQLRSVFIPLAHDRLPAASLRALVCCSAPSPTSTSETAGMYGTAARWPDQAEVWPPPHTAQAVEGTVEQELADEDQVRRFVQFMRAERGRRLRCCELQLRHEIETTQDGSGRTCRQAFFDALDAREVDGWDVPSTGHVDSVISVPLSWRSWKWIEGHIPALGPVPSF